MGKPSKLSDEDWERLLDRHARGERRADLAREKGVSVSTISWQAKKRGRRLGETPGAVDHRRRPAEGWPPDHVFVQSRSGMTPARWRELLARRNAGETRAVLEAEYGVTTGAIGCAAKRYGLRKMDTPGAVYQPRGPAAGAYNYGRGEPALSIDIDWSDPVGTVRALHADVLKRLGDGDEPEAARLWRWSQRTRVMTGVGAADLRALWKKPASFPGGYRPSGYMSPQTPGLAGALVLRPAQKPPEGDWSTWLFLGGRGAGKTLAGASWIADMAERLGPGGRLALIGATLHDVREVMIEGPSGVMSLPRWTLAGPDGDRGLEPGPWRGPVYQPSRRRLVFPDGAEAFVFSAEEPERLRGPQFAAAWADEFCTWRRGGETLALLRMGLRLALPEPDSPAADPFPLQDGGAGAQEARLREPSVSPPTCAQEARLREPSVSPRLVVTTTPRPTRALKELRLQPGVAETHATTRENAGHLAPGFLAGLERLYGGTRRAAQELEGRVVEPVGGLFTAEMMAAARGELAPPVDARPRFDRVVVGLDPTCSRGGDACGIVAVGRREGVAWVLADRSMRGLSPQKWAERAMETARMFGARRIVGEVNQGGDMVEAVLRTAGCGVEAPEGEAKGSGILFRPARAWRGKAARAEPVAALYEQGRVRHAGDFAALEEELMALGAAEDDAPDEGHWDRADALVWAVTDLMLNDRSEGPRVRRL
ncbi:terminase family protein [uncultured Brevundimonas sp.]|uniref:phage terminase large subunit family protein n=1 Tax=uncultured Brevundimonas sp. TaxID=213418 RepID=UPI002607AD26|nr:terminase family protein [uncultured Brevundimonas sp.]